MRDSWQGQEEVVPCGQLWWMVVQCPGAGARDAAAGTEGLCYALVQ